jgi:outer membrane lipoprotein carrier protein
MIFLTLLFVMASAVPDGGPVQKPEPSTTESTPMDPEVKRAVDTMQKFYEETKDFQADFHQTYLYKSFGRSSEAWGEVRFSKVGPSMRWDYQKPDVKVFVVSGEKIYAYSKESNQLLVSRLNADRLSASITFLWGQGKLEREFRISKANRPDLKNGIALELVPKFPDPRFQRVFFLLDPKTYSVVESLVVDPDGNENRMAFLKVKKNVGFGSEAFKIDHPSDTQIVHQDVP